MDSIDEIDISVPGWAKENFGALGSTCKGVRCSISGAEVGFRFRNPADQVLPLEPSNQQLAQEGARYRIRRSKKEVPRNRQVVTGVFDNSL